MKRHDEACIIIDECFTLLNAYSTIKTSDTCIKYSMAPKKMKMCSSWKVLQKNLIIGTEQIF